MPAVSTPSPPGGRQSRAPVPFVFAGRHRQDRLFEASPPNAVLLLLSLRSIRHQSPYWPGSPYPYATHAPDASPNSARQTRSGETWKNHPPGERRLEGRPVSPPNAESCHADEGSIWLVTREASATETHIVGMVTPVNNSGARCFLRQHDKTQRLAGMGWKALPIGL